MKRVYYIAGPPTLFAGIAGRFTLGKAKPVSDLVAEQLIARPEFKLAGAGIDDDETQDIKALEAAAIAADKEDAKAAKDAKDKQAASAKTAPVETKEEVNTNV